MTIRSTLLTSLAAAALLSGTAFAQQADTETETTSTTVPIEDVSEDAVDGTEEAGDASMMAEDGAEGSEGDSTMAAEDADAMTEGSDMAEGEDPQAEEGEGVIAEAEAGDTDTTETTIPIEDVAEGEADSSEEVGTDATMATDDADAMTDEAEMAEGQDAQTEEDEGVIAEAEVGETETIEGTVPVEDVAESETEGDAVEMESAQVETTTGSTGMFGTFGETRVADLIGLQVLAMDGENVGEVDNLVNFDGEPTAIVGVGGFLGLGEQDIAIPLQRFEMTEEGLMLPDTTEDEIEAMQEWDGETGEEMQRDMTVREAASL